MREAAPARRDAALLLVGHGSESVEGAGNGLVAHAARIRATDLFGSVEAGFLNGAPDLETALARISERIVYVVPFFMGEGYFTRAAIPRRLGLTGAESRVEGRVLRYCAPVGCDDIFAGVLCAHAERACAASGLEPARTTLVLVGHGNPHSSESSRALRRHASVLGRDGPFEVVETAFIEEEPLLAPVLRGSAGRDVVAVGVLAGEGKHTVEDVPNLVRDEQGRRREADEPGALLYAGVIGPAPEMVGLILRQVEAFDRGAPGAIGPGPKPPAGAAPSGEPARDGERDGARAF